MQKSNKTLKTIRIFEPGGKLNDKNEEILDKVLDGVLLIDDYNRFEGVIYKGENVEFIKGYLGVNVISIDLLDKSIYAFKKGNDMYDGVIDTSSEEDCEIPCKVFLGNLKENNTIDTKELNSKILFLKNKKVMNLERTLKR